MTRQKPWNCESEMISKIISQNSVRDMLTTWNCGMLTSFEIQMADTYTLPSSTKVSLSSENKNEMFLTSG